MGLMRAKLARGGPARAMTQADYLAALRHAVERSGLPVARSGGGRGAYCIIPGPPLGVGHTSRCEYVDFEMSEPISGTDFGRRLGQALPAGLKVLWQRRLPAGTPHLMASVSSLSYAVQGRFAREPAERFFAASTWPMTRKRAKKEQLLDLRRSVAKIDANSTGVSLTILVRPEGTPQPQEALRSIFGLTEEEASGLVVERTAVELRPVCGSLDPYRER